MTKLMTVAELERAGEFGGVYCINSTPSEARSQIVFTVHKMSGDGLDNVFIPATGFPIELTTQVTKRQLLNSSEFRKAVANRLIQLISEEGYSEMMGEEGSYEEVNNAMREMTATVEVNGSVASSTAKADLVQDSNPASAVHPQVTLTVEQLLAEDLTERAALAKLRNLGELNKRSYQHISKQTKPYPMIQNWINRIREERFAA